MSSRQVSAGRTTDAPTMLARREVSFLIIARFFALFGDYASAFMIPVAVYTATGSTALAGVAFTVRWLPEVLSLPVLGLLAERFPMRGQLVVTDAARAAILVVLVWQHSPVVLLIASGFLALLNGHSLIAVETAVARYVTADAMADAQAKMQTAQQAAMIVGPALGGALLVWWQIGAGSAVVAALFLIAATATLALVRAEVMRRAPDSDPAAAGPVRKLVAGAVATGRNRPLVTLILITITINLVGGLAMAALPVIVVGELAGNESAVGLVAGLASLASLGAAFAVNGALRRTTMARVAAVAFGALIVSAPAMGLSPSVVLFGLAYAVWMAGIAVFSIWMRTMRNQLVSQEELGSTLGFFVAAVLASTPIAGVLLSVFGERMQAQALVLVAAAVSAVVLVPLSVAWRRQRAGTAST